VKKKKNPGNESRRKNRNKGGKTRTALSFCGGKTGERAEQKKETRKPRLNKKGVKNPPCSWNEIKGDDGNWFWGVGGGDVGGGPDRTGQSSQGILAPLNGRTRMQCRQEIPPQKGIGGKFAKRKGLGEGVWALLYRAEVP